MAQRFTCTINSKRISPMVRDRLHWKETKGGVFIVRTIFDLLEGGRQQLASVKMLWNRCVPTKVGFFAWEAW